jgi:hypothetical protein
MASLARAPRPGSGSGDKKEAHARAPARPHRGAALVARGLCRTLWQIRLLLGRRSLWVAFFLITLLATAAAFVHGVQHGDGPMLARAEFISPMLIRHFYLIIVFMSAAMVGLAARRDLQQGLCDMFDATPAPDAVRLAGRIQHRPGGRGAVRMHSSRWCQPGRLGHGCGDRPLVALYTPDEHPLAGHPGTGCHHHAAAYLISHAGTAHAASMLAAFIMVVNFEVGLVNYPPYQIGRGVHIALSGLTGLSPWLDKIALGNAFKLGLVLLLIALSAVLTRRGVDEGWGKRLQGTRRKLAGWPGLVALAGLVVLAASGCAASALRRPGRLPDAGRGIVRPCPLGATLAGYPGRLLAGRRRGAADSAAARALAAGLLAHRRTPDRRRRAACPTTTGSESTVGHTGWQAGSHCTSTPT